MPVGYPGGDVKEAIGNSYLESDLRVFCMKMVVKAKGKSGRLNRVCL